MFNTNEKCDFTTFSTYISTGNTSLPEGEWPENAFHAFINMPTFKIQIQVTRYIESRLKERHWRALNTESALNQPFTLYSGALVLAVKEITVIKTMWPFTLQSVRLLSLLV